jgi:hypothetical protein
MTAQPPPPTPPPTPTASPSIPTPVEQSPPVTTKLGTFTRKLVMNVLEFVDQVFWLIGPLGRTVIASIQDAIALGILLKLPSLIGEIIIGKDFSSFDICLKESAFGASRYACFIIVASDFLLWIVLAGRIIARFRADLKDLKNNP